MKKSALTLVLVAVTSLAVAAGASAKTAARFQVDFVKHVVDPQNFVFEGTVSGAVSGHLTSRLVSLDAQQGQVLRITFDWIVDAGDKSFTARTKGAWNQKTGKVVMDGSVIAGYKLGARVHEEGRLVDPATLTFEGYLRLMARPEA